MAILSPGCGRGLLCRAGVAAMFLAAISACGSNSSSFPGQIPNSGGIVTDVSSVQAFRDHDIEIPKSALKLNYAADSGIDGYPLSAYFELPCSAVPDFVVKNSLYKDSGYHDLPSMSVVMLAEKFGRRPSRSAASWYQRPRGGNANLEVMVSGVGAVCTAYLTATQL